MDPLFLNKITLCDPPEWKKEWPNSFVDVLDGEFLIQWWCDGHWCEFKVFEVWGRDGKTNEPRFEHIDGELTKEDTKDLNKAVPYMRGHCKWDGCFEHHLTKYHWCGSNDLKKHLKLLVYLYQRAHKEMESIDPWEDEGEKEGTT